MWWIIFGVFAALAVAAGWWADRYSRAQRGVPGRHEDTGRFETVKHDTATGYEEYRTAVLPVQGDILTDTGTIIVKHDAKALPVTSQVVSLPEPVRTDTVFMEAVDPKNYPDWIKEELERLQ